MRVLRQRQTQNLDEQAADFALTLVVEKQGSSVTELPAMQVTADVAEAIRREFWAGKDEADIARERGLTHLQVDEVLRPLLPDQYGYDWTGCDEVVHIRGMMSGVPILKQIRMPAGDVAEFYKDGQSPASISTHYSLPLEQVKRVLEFAFPAQRFARTGIDWTGCGTVVGNNEHLKPWVVRGTSVDPDAVVELVREQDVDAVIEATDLPKEVIRKLLYFAVPAAHRANENTVRS